MEVNSNLDPDLLILLEQLKGRHINFFAGLNLNVYQNDNVVNYQFHSGVYLSTYTTEQATIAFFFNGKIVEEDDGRDRFYLEVSTTSFEKSLADYSVLYPRFVYEEQTLNYQIIDIVPYFLDGNKTSEIFAIHFKCKYDKDFMIRFQFPADGLHLSIGENEISSFLNSNSFGKKLKTRPITR